MYVFRQSVCSLALSSQCTAYAVGHLHLIYQIVVTHADIHSSSLVDQVSTSKSLSNLNHTLFKIATHLWP